MAMKTRFGQGRVVADLRKADKEGYLTKGTMEKARVNIIGRIMENFSDELDIYKWINMQRKNGRKIMKSTAYRVCKAGPKVGPNTAHMKKVKALMIKGVLTPKPRRKT